MAYLGGIFFANMGGWGWSEFFSKRVVLANLPSFRFSFRGNMRTYPRSGFRSGGTFECTLVPVFVPGEHLPKPPFWKTTLLSTPDLLLGWLLEIVFFLVCLGCLVAPYRAILRYYRCDTPYRAILFKKGEHSPNMVRYPPLVLSFTQAH